MSRSLASFPEELLARILALSVAPPPRAPSDVFPPPRRRIAPLLVSRQFFRIASPLFYHTLRFGSSHQASRALAALTRHPTLAHAVRSLEFGGIWKDSAAVLALCGSLHEIDICLDSGPAGDEHDVDAEAFCCALEHHHAITHLTIRKDTAVYLTHSRPSYVLERLAQAVRHWTRLETVHFALRISSSSSTLTLARALSVAPRLSSVRAQLPAVWNTLLLTISTNPCLEKVFLYGEPAVGPMYMWAHPNTGSAVIKDGHACDNIEHAILGAGLYMMEAKKHARLSELIKSGTISGDSFSSAIVRTRAHTTIATLSTPPASGTPLGAVRAKEVAVELLSNRDSFGMALAQPFATARPLHAQVI